MANIGRTDKILRLLGGLVLLGISFVMLGGLSTAPGIVAIVVSVILIGTALVNFCPAYKLLGIGTAKEE